MTEVLLLEPEVTYPNPGPNTGMNLGLLALAGAIGDALSDVDIKFWSAQIALLAAESGLPYPTLDDVAYSADVCLISALTCQIDHANRYAEQVKNLGVPRVVLGGAFATSAGRRVATEYPAFDHVVRGAGEGAVLDLLSGQSTKRFADGSRQDSSFGEPEASRPSIDAFPNELAVDLGLRATVEIARGCPYECEYCTLIEHSSEVRHQSLRAWEGHLSAVYDAGYRRIFVCDDTFYLRPSVARPYMEVLTSVYGDSAEVFVMTRAEVVKEAAVADFARFGINEVLIGVEHVDERMLHSMHKTPNPDAYTRMVRNSLRHLSSAGIVAHPVFLLGWAGETEESLNALVDFATEVGSDPLVQPFVAFATPHPGSRLWNRRKEIGLELLPASLSSYTHLSPVAYPSSLGDKDTALELLVAAHNTIRVETGGARRNPTIEVSSAFLPGSLADLSRWDDPLSPASITPEAPSRPVGLAGGLP